MELIAANTRINAKPAGVLTALTTTDGFRHWWTDDAEVGRVIGAAAIFRFGTIEVTFLIDRIDRQGIEMTCVDHENHPEWLLRTPPPEGGGSPNQCCGHADSVMSQHVTFETLASSRCRLDSISLTI